MNFSDYAELEKRAEAHGLGDDPTLAQLLHIIQFKEAVKNGHKRTMRELDVWEKNIARCVEQRIKEAEGLYMITDDVRREVAKELRELATPGCIRYAEEFYEELREIVASDLDGSFDGVANSLADLIDRPTCKIILARELRTAYGKPITGINGYILSCGHQVVGFEKPRYCPECGMEVGE